MGRIAVGDRGVQAALGAAVLFGAGTPLAKLLLAADVSPWLLAGLLYAGSGVGLGLYRLIRRPGRVRIAPGELPWLAGAIGHAIEQWNFAEALDLLDRAARNEGGSND